MSERYLANHDLINKMSASTELYLPSNKPQGKYKKEETGKSKNPANTPASYIRARRNTEKLTIVKGHANSVLLFRTKVIYSSFEYEPTTSSEDISKAVFGSDPNDVSMAEQFETCSISGIHLDAGNPKGVTMASKGVIDMEVQPKGLRASEVAAAVNAKAATDLRINVDDYDHIIYNFPSIVTLYGRRGWTGWAEKVS